MDWAGSPVKWRSIATTPTTSASPAEPGLRSALGLTALSAVTFVLTLVTQWGILVLAGAEERTDALFGSLVIPQTLLAIFGVSLGHVLVPLFAGDNEADCRRHAWGLFLWAAGAGGLLGAILAMTASLWVPVVFPGFRQPDVAVQLCRIQCLALVLSSGASVFSAALHARNRFVGPEWAQAAGQAACLLVIVLGLPEFGVVVAAWGFVVRSLVHVGLLIPQVGLGRPANLPRELRGRLWGRWRPLLAGTGFYKTDLVVDAFLSSMAGAGALSLYYLAQRLYGAVLDIVRKSFSDPVLPVLSIRAHQGREQEFRHLYRKRILLILTFLVPAYGLLLTVGEPLLHALIGRGGITSENVRSLWIILVTLGGVFLGGAAGQVVSFAWYARGNTRIPTQVGIYGFPVAIILKIVGFWKFGIVGLAICASLYYISTALVSFCLLERNREWPTRPA